MNKWRITGATTGADKMSAYFTDGVRFINYEGPIPDDMPTPSPDRNPGDDLPAHNAAIWNAVKQALDELSAGGPLPPNP